MISKQILAEFLPSLPTVKALLSHKGLIQFWTLQRGAYQRGGLIQKLDEKDIYDSFTSLLPHILQIQHTILGVNQFDRVLSQTIPK